MTWRELGTKPLDFWNPKFVMLVLTNEEDSVDTIEMENYNPSGIIIVFFVWMNDTFLI